MDRSCTHETFIQGIFKNAPSALIVNNPKFIERQYNRILKDDALYINRTPKAPKDHGLRITEMQV